MGDLEENPVSAGYTAMIYDQTVLGMDYLDCSNQTLARIDFKIKDHVGNVVNLHQNHILFSIIFVKASEEWKRSAYVCMKQFSFYNNI